MISTIVWGAGNIARAAIRAVDAHPGLELAAVLVHERAKVGRDAGELGGLGRTLGVAATDDAAAVLAGGPRAVVYAASGNTRSADAVADICAALRAGAVVVTESIYPLYDSRDDRHQVREPIREAIESGGGSLFVTSVDADWATGVLPLLLGGLGTRVDRIRCQEIVDYSDYDEPGSVRYLVGMGEPLDYLPPMLAPRMPTTVWGGQVRLLARALGVELDEIRETISRRALEVTVETDTMGKFEAGGQGALRFEVQGIVGGQPRIVIEHVNRIDPTCAPDWPTLPGDAAGTHRVLVDGEPRIDMTVRAAGRCGEETTVGRLVDAIAWLVERGPGLYDALDVPLRPSATIRADAVTA
ncbi:dihydrodipicolinate reductase [Rhodococcus spelaei]|uniref:Dihydrodipicolinate reductase n=1 Tax=Rhodococcus spelaei TaxID=2546320 RepID=A0A541BPP1_9NOCA|nr:dihydrodipicolinate reductase [Rhodococcus spelaei]TQF74275.1 dihydrodipicolinate reductase [Rhodococcus spelaei]